MTEETQPDRLAMIALVSGSATVLMGLLGIAGLATGLAAFSSFFPGYQAMAFSTALILILTGSIIAISSLRPFRGTIRLAILAVLVTLAIAEAFEFPFGIAGRHFVIEPVLIQFADSVFGRATSGISPIACGLSILAALSLFFVVLGPSRPAADPREKDIIGLTGIFLVLAGVTVLLGYVYGAPYLNGTDFVTIAAPTATAFVFIGIAITASAGSAAIPARYFTGPSTTAYLLRSFVPLALAIIVVQGLFHDLIDLFFANSRAVVFSVSIVIFSVVTGIVVVQAGRRAGAALEREEARRMDAETALTAANEELLSSNEELTMLGEELTAGVESLRLSEQALLESRRRLERTQEIARLGSWDLDLVNNQLAWSDEVYRIFGREPGEFPATYEAFLDGVHPDDRAAVNEAYTRSLNDGSSTYEIDHRVIRKLTGEVRYVHEKCEHVRDSTGKVIRSTGMVHDITDRKEAEAALQRVIASWNVTFNAMNDRVCLMDAGGSILRCNESMQALAGLPSDAIVGKPCHEVMHRSAAFIEGCPFQAMLKTGKREQRELQVGNRWFVVSADPVADDTGTITGAVHVMHDITEQRVAQEELVNRNEELAAIEEELRQNVDELGKKEQELRETGQYLENLIEYANAPIIVWNPASRITRFNRAFERLTGRPASSVIGQPLGILFPEGGKDASLDLIRKTISGERWESVEIPILHTHGTVRTVLWNSATLYGTDGKTVTSIIAQGQDITDRKNAEERLQQALASWMVTFNAMNDLVCLIDRNGLIELCNEGMSRFVGLPPEKIAGRRCRDLMGLAESDAMHCPIDAMLVSGKRESSELEIGGKWFSITADPIRNKAGGVTGGVQILRDITVRKQAEEALHSSEVRYRTLFETTKDGILILDGDTGIVTDANPGVVAMLEFGREDLIGRPLSGIGFIRNRELAENAVAELKKNGYVRYEDLPLETKAGQAVDAEFVSNTYTVNGKRMIQCNIRDITVRKRLEMEMAQSLREKEVLLKEIHHRVKNNIQVISSILSLQSNQARDPATKEIFRETQNKVRGIALIHEKLYRSRSLSKINYGDYLRDITTHTFQSYSVNPRQIGLRIDAGDVAIDIDRAVPLSLIVTELLSNALKHAFPGGRQGEIAIGIRPVGRDLVLSFADNGIGLPASVTFDKGDTLGMGLLAGLTRQLSGTIAIDRSAGTRYTVTFPAGDEAGSQGTTPAPAPAPSAGAAFGTGGAPPRSEPGVPPPGNGAWDLAGGEQTDGLRRV